MWCSTVGCIAILILSLLAAPLAAQAQRPGKLPRIGYLTPSAASSPLIEAFRHGLHDFGYMEGHNLHIEYRFADGQFERLPALAAELVQLPVDVLVTSGPSALAAQHTTATIPIVFAVFAAPVEEGLVASLARPGGNVTGLSSRTGELAAKRLELLTEFVPADSIGVRNLMEKRDVEKRHAGYWVAGTRVSLASIVLAFLDGLSPETIATECFPVLTLEQVYGAITYYLAQRAEIDRYLQQVDAEFDALRHATCSADPHCHAKLVQARRQGQMTQT